MKKNLFYLFTIAILLIIFVIIQEITFKNISKYFADKKSYNLIKKYINETNHIRSHVDYSICNETNKPQCLLFNEISNKKNDMTVYINGDSWAEGFRIVDLTTNIFSNFSNENNVNIILAGTTSYSFSPMLSQLRILNRDWNINPDIIVSIFDQTDIGDELCRYKDYRLITSAGDIIVKKFNRKDLHEVYNYTRFLDRHEIFYSNDYKFIKILKLINLYIENRKIIPLKPKCSFDNIQKYLIEPLSLEDRLYIENMINQYLEKVFGYNKVKKLLLVTHPHKQHFKGIYKLDLGDIVENVVIKSPYKKKITLINFTKNKIINLDDFLADDPASHLNYERGYFKYATHILDTLKKEIN